LPQTLKDLESGNKQLQTLRMAQQQTQFEIKEQESFYYPRVNLNAGYNFTSNSSTQGLFLVNQSRGPVAGLALNWNLYNGTQRKQVENAKLLHQNTTLQYQDAKIGLETMVINAWQNYNDALQLAKTEQESYKMAQEYVAITMERFRLNEATILELKDAQQSIEASVTRLANTLYEAKNAETELLFLIGKLVK
jgi:outer membrane protein